MNEEKDDDIIYEHVVLSHTSIDDGPPMPPPPNYTSPFTTIHDWLSNMVEVDEHNKSIEEYQFVTMQSPDKTLLTVFGMNNYEIDHNTTHNKTEFTPTHEYFVLPKDVSKNLSLEQQYQWIQNELIAFVNTETFKNSFLAKGGKVTTGFTIGYDRVLWPIDERNSEEVRKSIDSIDNRLKPIDEKLKAFAHRIGADFIGDGSMNFYNGSSIEIPGITERRISWVDGNIGKGIFLSPIFTTGDNKHPSWRLFTLAWLQDASSDRFWMKNIIPDSSFETIEKNIDQLLVTSEEVLKNVKDEDLK